VEAGEHKGIYKTTLFFFPCLRFSPAATAAAISTAPSPLPHELATRRRPA
jgi:hypothetical protein